MNFIRSVFQEMKMVNWPTEAELMRYTGIVITTVLIFAVFLGLVDWGASEAFKWFINL